MNNIFTFEQQDEEQFENKQNIQSINPSEQTVMTLAQSHKTKEEPLNLNNCNQFEFKDFEQEQIKKELRKPLQTIQDSTTNFKAQKSEKEENKQIPQMRKNVRRLKKDSNSTPLCGLQVKDLGIKQMQYVSEKKALKVTDMRKFLHAPLREYKVKAIIRKEEGSLFSFNSKFNVYIQQNNRYLFTINREGITEYNFSLQKNNCSQKKKSFFGKMFSNIIGTQFLLFDNGFSPEETRQLQCCRKQLASIKYETGSVPRKFTAIISTNSQGFYSLEPEQNILQLKWQKKQRNYLSILYSKAPQLDPEDGNYKLDFKGIVKKASVKNFILGGKQWNDSLIFGKIDKDTFIMEIKQPLGVFQAAAICVSSIHYKFNWK